MFIEKDLNSQMGEKAAQKKLAAFLNSFSDAYAIMQLRRCPEAADECFMTLDWLHRKGKEPDFTHYEVVWVDDLPEYSEQAELLEGFYIKFNLDRPPEFIGHSMSVSDIVALKRNGVVTFHFVDSIGFAELRGFVKEL